MIGTVRAAGERCEGMFCHLRRNISDEIKSAKLPLSGLQLQDEGNDAKDKTEPSLGKVPDALTYNPF